MRQRHDVLWSDRSARRVGRRYHAHFPGVVYVVTTVVLVLGALNGQNNLLFAIFGLAVGALIVSGLLSGVNLMGISVQRLEPGASAVGEEAAIRYRVRNSNRLFPAIAVTVEELCGHECFSRVVAFVMYLPPRGEVVVTAHPQARRRGVWSLSRFRAVSTFPFGLTKKSVLYEQHGEVLVRPRPADINAALIRSGLGSSPRGGRRRRWRGGEEFWALREFAAGDSVRSVAWRPSARVGQMLVRDSAQPAADRMWIQFEPGENDEQTERVLSVAAGLFIWACGASIPVGLRSASGAVLVPIRCSQAHAASGLDELARWTPLSSQPAAADSPDLQPGEGVRVLVVSQCDRSSPAAGQIGANDASLVRWPQEQLAEAVPSEGPVLP